jgi:hypothetical protein
VEVTAAEDIDFPSSTTAVEVDTLLEEAGNRVVPLGPATLLFLQELVLRTRSTPRKL